MEPERIPSPTPELPLIVRIAPVFMFLGALQLAITPLILADSDVQLYPAELMNWNFISAATLLIGSFGVWKRQRWAAFLVVCWAVVQNFIYASAGKWTIGLLFGAIFYFALLFPYMFPQQYADFVEKQRKGNQ